MKIAISIKLGLVLFFTTAMVQTCLAQTSIDSLLNVGNFELYENPNKAINIGIKILNAKECTDEFEIEALLLISTAYSSKRNYEKSLSYATKALNVLPQINDDAFKVRVYNRIGLQYQQLKMYDNALLYLDKALQIATASKQKENFDKLIGFNYAGRGFIYREQMSCDIAQNYFNKSLYYFKRNLKAPLMNANLSIISYNKGNCFIASNQIDSAKISFNQAIDFSKKIEANSLEAFAYKGLAEVHTSEGNYSLAIKQLTDALKIAEKVGDLVLNEGIYKGLADNYLAVNNHKLYHKYVLKYNEIKKQTHDAETKTINQLIVQDDKEASIKIEQQISSSLYYRIPLISLIVLLIGLCFFEYFRYKKKFKKLKTDKLDLEKQSS